MKGRSMNDQHAGEAFAALVCIETGQWDAYLLRLFRALQVRMQSDEVRRRWVSGAITLDEIPPQAPLFTPLDEELEG